MIAALFVETGGSYFNLADVDPWDITRDARRYEGPHPVVAHPPCQLWGAFAAVNYARWGGEHNKPGNDNGCFASALRSVVTYGGVLEHPLLSKAWAAHGIVIPKTPGWHRHGLHEWTCQVRQAAYGHRANKATGLLYSGLQPPFDLDWSRVAGSHQIGQHDQRGPARNKPTVGKKEASATPPAFREALIALARRSQESQ
jgi:hypothetical protein